jgi:hypothetical protein
MRVTGYAILHILEYYLHPPGLNIRFVDAGYFSSLLAGRRGRGTKSPPQFGQIPPSTESTQDAQKVHSKVQILASKESGGKSLLQHSQFGRNSSIIFLVFDAL